MSKITYHNPFAAFESHSSGGVDTALQIFTCTNIIKQKHAQTGTHSQQISLKGGGPNAAPAVPAGYLLDGL